MYIPECGTGSRSFRKCDSGSMPFLYVDPRFRRFLESGSGSRCIPEADSDPNLGKDRIVPIWLFIVKNVVLVIVVDNWNIFMFFFLYFKLMRKVPLPLF